MTSAALSLPTLTRVEPGRPVAHNGLVCEPLPVPVYTVQTPPIAPAPIMDSVPPPPVVEPFLASVPAALVPAEVVPSKPVLSEPSEALPAPEACIRSLGEIEKKAILDTLVATEGNRTKAAELLGISIRTLRNKLNEYRIDEGLVGK